MNKTFFTSDTHFYHKNIMKFCPESRPFNNVSEMNDYLIMDWNSKVGENDDVWHLGDFAFCGNKQLIEVLDQLNGNIHLVLGNHDKGIAKQASMHRRFASVHQYKKLVIENNTFILFHYPIYEWDKMHKGSIHLFGHVHDTFKTIGGKSMNVGCDTRKDCSLYSLEEELEFVEDKPILQHHDVRRSLV